MTTNSNSLRVSIAWITVVVSLTTAAPAAADFQVNTYTTGDQQYPDVSTDPSGNFVVVWQGDGQDGSGTGVFAQRFGQGAQRLGAEVAINATSIRDQGHPAVAMNDDGDFRVVWESYNQDGDGWGVYQRTFESNAVPLSGDVRVNTITTGDQDTPVVAARERISVGPTVWEDDSGPNTDVVFDMLPMSGDLQVPSITSNYQFDPAIGCLTLDEPPFPDDVTFIGAWASGDDGDGFGIFARRRHVISPPGPLQFQVNSYTTGIQRHPAVACDPDPAGNVMIVWESVGQDGDGLGVFGRLFDRVTLLPVGGELQVNSYTGSHQRYPDVAADDDGNFLVVWQSHPQDGSGDGIFARRYDSTGTPLGSELGVNEHTLNAQLRPRVAAGPDGSFIVAWASQGQDGDGRGVFARRFVPADAGETSTITLFPGITASVTTPNEGLISMDPGDPAGFFVANGFLSVSIGAPPATAADPLVLVFEFADASTILPFYEEMWPGYTDEFVKVYRNGVEVPDCTGAPGTVDPDPCVQGRVLDMDGDLIITVLTSAASQWDFTLGTCPATVDPACTTGFGKGSLTVQQGDPAKQKLIAKLIKGPALVQTDLGNPLDPAAAGTGTIVTLCLYDDGGGLAGELYVSRAGDTCAGEPCWSPVGRAPNDPQGPGSGYKYKDAAQDTDGVKSILYKAGQAGQSKVMVKASGPNLPAGIAAALEGSTEATVQLRAVDGECLSATLTDVKRNQAGVFKAK